MLVLHHSVVAYESCKIVFHDKFLAVFLLGPHAEMVIAESALKFTNTWWAFPTCSIISLYRCFRTRIQFSTSPAYSPSSKALHCCEEESEDFLQWLQRKAGTEISSMLKIGESSFGRALYASETIRSGDCILRVPYKAQLAPDNLPGEIFSLLGEEVSNVAKVAVLLLYEQKLGQESQWAPYIDRLPKLSTMHNTIFWSDNELKMIEETSVFQEAIKQRSQIKEEFLAVKPILDHFSASFKHVTLDDFIHAHALVTSRAWESSRGVSMIPFADFLNHDGQSDACVLNDEGDQFSEVIADRDYVPGEQVLIRYGNFSNGTLLLDFGFTLPCNIYDQVPVEFSIPHHDNLRQMKLELLRRYRAPDIRDINKPPEDIFTLKKVKSSDGNGRGIPQSFRAFARVLCLNSAQELSHLAKEAAQNDGRLGRRALDNKGKEIEAHQLMFSCITGLMNQYETSIENLGQLPKVQNMIRKCDSRRQMAHDLLTGELDILKSASAWLKNYYTSLSKR